MQTKLRVTMLMSLILEENRGAVEDEAIEGKGMQ